MALKPYRQIVLSDTETFSTAACDRGGIVCNTGTASGSAEDSSVMTGAYAAHPSGYRPLGVLINDVVNKDLTQTHLNQHKYEVQVGSKMTLVKVGVLTTNLIEGTPAKGGKAYIGHSGYFSATALPDDSAVAGVDNVVGRFETVKDQDGYCRVYVNVR